MILALILFLLEPFSLIFFSIYTMCGITDALDGAIARLTHTQSAFGAWLDSIADVVFMASSMMILFPYLMETWAGWELYALIMIAGIKALAYIIGIIKFHRMAMLHTWLNKITGFGVFCYPYFIKQSLIDCYTVIICVIAFLTALEECICIIKSKAYNADIRGIIDL